MSTTELQAQKAASRDKRRFVRMTVDGVSCICERDEVKDLLDGAGIAAYELTEVWMTQERYDALPEFEGW